MAKRVWRAHFKPSAVHLLLSCAALVGLPITRAEAQVVQDCQPTQYLVRSAPNADRELTWDFSITTDPERCLEVQVGQTVVWSGELDTHPLAGSGGTAPNPISLHQNGSVTFNVVGTFGFVCLSHSSMKGAIKVVPASFVAASVPAASTWLWALLMLLLLASGVLLAKHDRRHTQP